MTPRVDRKSRTGRSEYKTNTVDRCVSNHYTQRMVFLKAILEEHCIFFLTFETMKLKDLLFLIEHFRIFLNQEPNIAPLSDFADEICLLLLPLFFSCFRHCT